MNGGRERGDEATRGGQQRHYRLEQGGRKGMQEQEQSKQTLEAPTPLLELAEERAEAALFALAPRSRLVPLSFCIDDMQACTEIRMSVQEYNGHEGTQDR